MSQDHQAVSPSSCNCTRPDCDICRYDFNIDLPEQLIDDFQHNRVALFLGAGVSTENPAVRPAQYTLYEKAKSSVDASISPEASFSEVMQAYSDQHGRHRLAAMIRSHLDYGRLFPEVLDAETRFHRELATLPNTDAIYTTNWDVHVETVCHATPLVTGEDVAYWDLPGRKVFKLHGSITSIGSIVATSDEYRLCYERLRDGAIGAFLKTALATKTVVFLGYSFCDSDFQQLWCAVSRDIGIAAKRCYWVNPHESVDGGEKPDNLEQLRVDATHFLRLLKQRLIETGFMLPDSRWSAVAEIRTLAEDAHRHVLDRYPLSRYPDAIYALSYQDGLMHACDWLIAQAFAGQAAHNCVVRATVPKYLELLDERRKNRNYLDVAYIEGFLNGMKLALTESDGLHQIPLYFSFGTRESLSSKASFRRAIRVARHAHKTASTTARRFVERFLDESNEQVSMHHTPFL
ncbi:MAG: SIR2 family protein [Planctomycetota bacterium]